MNMSFGVVCTRIFDTKTRGFTQCSQFHAVVQKVLKVGCALSFRNMATYANRTKRDKADSSVQKIQNCDCMLFVAYCGRHAYMHPHP